MDIRDPESLREDVFGFHLLVPLHCLNEDFPLSIFLISSKELAHATESERNEFVE